jgi:hypothetical protein
MVNKKSPGRFCIDPGIPWFIHMIIKHMSPVHGGSASIPGRSSDFRLVLLPRLPVVKGLILAISASGFGSSSSKYLHVFLRRKTLPSLILPEIIALALSTVALCGSRPRLQRRARPGFAPGSLFLLG